MTADVVTLLKKTHSMGEDFWLENDTVVVSAPHPLPMELMVELRQHKEDIEAWICQATACVCPVPIGPTGVEGAPSVNYPLSAPCTRDAGAAR